MQSKASPDKRMLWNIWNKNINFLNDFIAVENTNLMPKPERAKINKRKYDNLVPKSFFYY